MDDRETVNHCEAVVGLSLLGVLSMALVSTVVYRIVSTAPGSPGPTRPVSIVEVDPAPYGARATDPGYAATSMPGNEQVEPAARPGDDRGEAAVPMAASSTDGVSRFDLPSEYQATPATAEAPVDEAPTPLTEAPPFTPAPTETEAPRFVAPASR